MDNGYMMQQPTGWQCPVCGKVYAPWVSECSRCGEVTITNTTVGTLPNDYIRRFMVGLERPCSEEWVNMKDNGKEDDCGKIQELDRDDVRTFDS